MNINNLSFDQCWLKNMVIATIIVGRKPAPLHEGGSSAEDHDAGGQDVFGGRVPHRLIANLCVDESEGGAWRGHQSFGK
jgi:hypothetical protein